MTVRPHRSIALIATIAIALTFLLIILGLSTMVFSSPNALFPLLILLLTCTLGALIKASYPPSVEGEVQGPSEDDPENLGGSSQAAPKGWKDEVRQYQAYLELKHLLIERVLTRRNIKRDEWDTMVKDHRALYQVLLDEDLLRLVALDDRATRAPRSHRIEGVVFGPGFRKRFELLLGKVERWQ